MSSPGFEEGFVTATAPLRRGHEPNKCGMQRWPPAGWPPWPQLSRRQFNRMQDQQCMCEWPDPDRDSHPRRMAGRGGFQEFMLQHNMAALQLHTFPARVQGAREALSSDEYRLKQT